MILASQLFAGSPKAVVSRSDGASFAEMQLGLFVHYAYAHGGNTGTRSPDGAPIGLEALADGLDVGGLAECAAEMRAQYVQFTTWHANMNALFPSKVLRDRLPGHCSRRDAIADLSRALRGKGIRLILYLHPSDGHDLSRAEQDRVGWNDGPPYTRWNDFVNDLVAEVVERYGKDDSGYYIDGGLPAQVDARRLRKTILDRQPRAWLIQNSGLNRDCVDFGSREGCDLRPPFSATTWQAACVMSKNWWAETGGKASVQPEFAYRYAILQSAVSGRRGGGLACAFGPYPGGKWEPGIRDFTKRLGLLIDRAKPSFFGARPSTAFVTKEKQALDGLPYAATESPDGKKTYLHVFLPPRDGVLKLPAPANGRRFSTANLLHGRDEIAITQTDTSLQLTLGPAVHWDDVDTIIVLE